MSATLDGAAVADFRGAFLGMRTTWWCPRAARFDGSRRAPADAPTIACSRKQLAAAIRRLVPRSASTATCWCSCPAPARSAAAADDARARSRPRSTSARAPAARRSASSDEQDRAIAPAPRRKVILSTNVAETSVTIDGVVAVIDAGLARVARHSPWSGHAQLLVVEPISQRQRDRSAQAAPAAPAPGRCLRLYTRHDFDDRRPAYDLPEVMRADLAEAALELHAAGFARLDRRRRGSSRRRAVAPATRPTSCCPRWARSTPPAR
jgi:hypothetical protein